MPKELCCAVARASSTDDSHNTATFFVESIASDRGFHEDQVHMTMYRLDEKNGRLSHVEKEEESSSWTLSSSVGGSGKHMVVACHTTGRAWRRMVPGFRFYNTNTGKREIAGPFPSWNSRIPTTDNNNTPKALAISDKRNEIIVACGGDGTDIDEPSVINLMVYGVKLPRPSSFESMRKG